MKPDPEGGMAAEAAGLLVALLLEPKENPDDEAAGAGGVALLEAKLKPPDAGTFVSGTEVLVEVVGAAEAAGLAPNENPEKGLFAAAASAPGAAGFGAATGAVDVEPKENPANGVEAAGADVADVVAGAPKETGALGVVLAPKLKDGAAADGVEAGAVDDAPKENPPKAGFGADSPAEALDWSSAQHLGISVTRTGVGADMPGPFPLFGIPLILLSALCAARRLTFCPPPGPKAYLVVRARRSAMTAYTYCIMDIHLPRQSPCRPVLRRPSSIGHLPLSWPFLRTTCDVF